jgi:hypothetical protein
MTINRHLFAGFVAATFALMPTAAQPAPGAHGPNGEHLDQAVTARAASGWPRLEARSDLFELVAERKPSEFVILLDRYETNEPVLGAKLEIEVGGAKALGAFRDATGDYAVTDAGILKALATPGEHAVVFTVFAGNESDLLDGTLVVPAPVTSGEHGHAGDWLAAVPPSTRWLAAGALAVVAASVIGIRARRQRSLRTSDAGHAP